MLKKLFEKLNNHLVSSSSSSSSLRSVEKRLKQQHVFFFKKQQQFVRSSCSSLPQPQPRHHNSNHHQHTHQNHQRNNFNHQNSSSSSSSSSLSSSSSSSRSTSVKYFRPLRLNLPSSVMTSNNKLAPPYVNSTVNYFGNSFLDRQSERRKDAKWLDQQMRSPKSVFILFHVDRPFMSLDETSNTFELSKFTYDQVRPFLETPPTTTANSDATATAAETEANKCNLLFLGIEYEKSERGKSMSETDGGEIWSIRSPYANVDNYYNRDEYRSWFAIETSAFDETGGDKVAQLLGERAGKFFEGNFLRMMAIHDVFESSVIAQARSVFCWLDRNKFCATCGHANHISDGGYKLACSNTTACKSHSRAANKHIPSNIHYPRVDPVAIMLVISPDQSHVLLGRKKAFPGRMYSCLAGYVEAGESFEEAVRRETFEEVGIHCDRVEYHSSQPWPFPSTLMLGCMAYARSTDIQVDNNELAEARWFTREEIELICRGQHPDGISIPPDRAIANRLINYWSSLGNSSNTGSKL